VLRTPRLIVRPVSETDRSRFVDLFSDAEFMAFSASGPLTAEAAELRFDHMVDLGREVPFAKQAVIEPSTGSTIGYAGVDVFEFRDVERLEFGYRLVPEARGRGYATEAARALLDLARTTFRGELLAFIDPQNHASRGVLGKLGFEFLEHIRMLGDPVELYGLAVGVTGPVPGGTARYLGG
jgi:RimJ/RimL family protein N-acetyltransferase